MGRFSPFLGAAAGVVGWFVLSRVLSQFPDGLRFVLTLFVFTFGVGSILVPLLSSASRPARVWMACGFGVGVAPLAADVLARAGLVSTFPYLSSALTGGAMTVLLRDSAPARKPPLALTWRGTLAIAVALITGAIAFAHRLDVTAAEIGVYGDYDSVDLSYYAAITSELAHHVPPMAPFYSGHALNYSWYPQMLLAMVHRFGDVGILPMYFRFAWPAFLAIAAACGYLFVAEFAGASVALLAMLLVLLGGDFSWVAAWFFMPETYLWDWLLWPTNFLSPTMEVLHFSTWTPSLPVMFVALFAATRRLRGGPWPWSAIAALCLALLVQFKPFAFAVLLGAMALAFVASPAARAARKDLFVIAGGAALLALPFLYQIATLYGESRSHLKFDAFLLPRTMLEKLNLTSAFEGVASAFPARFHAFALGLLATPLFFAGGLGARWIGIPGVFRAAFSRRGNVPAAGALLGWVVLTGIGLPFVLVTEPYHDTIQFYQTGLYILWVFTAMALVALGGARRTAAIVLACAVAVPPSVHFLRDKWLDEPTHPLAGASRGEQLIAEYLRGTDRERTIVMHDRPSDPSLLLILSERRTVLSWARYVTGSEERRADVDQFFASAAGDPQRALETLTRYGVTHVVVRRARDRVHPEVLAALRQVVGTPEATLYETPR